MEIKENINCYYNNIQREILIKLLSCKIINDDFFLTGGTALSVFYLHHRISNDLDFFTKSNINLSEKYYLIKKIWGNKAILIKESQTFISLLIGDTKIDLVIDKLSNNDIRKQINIENNILYIDTISNIVSNKLCAMVSRTEIKDFIDFYYICNDFTTLIDFDVIYSHSKDKEALFDDIPTVAYQLEENFNFLIKNNNIFPKIIREFDSLHFENYYIKLIKYIYNKFENI